MSMITELVKMKINDTVFPEVFIKIIDDLERNFHSRQAGFIDTELLHDEKADIWIMIQHWESVDELKAASSQMFKDNVTEAFRGAIDAKNITIEVFPRLGLWKKGEL